MNLDRSHGTIVIRGTVNGHRLPPGLYVVGIARDAHERDKVRTVTVRVSSNGRAHTTTDHPQSRCAHAALTGSWGASALPLTWAGAAALASLTKPAVGRTSPFTPPSSTPAGSGEAKALGARHGGVIPASIPQPSTVWGTMLVLGLVGALLVAMAMYIWRFLKTPADRQ